MKFNVAIPVVAILLTATLGLTAQTGFQSQESSSSYSGDTISLTECNVQLIQDIELPALESGLLTNILVKPGDYVGKNQKVGQMDDKRARRALESAKLRQQIAGDRANDNTEVNTTYKQAELAYQEHLKNNRLRRSGSMSEQQAERAKVSAEIANFQYKGAKNARRLAGVEAAAEMVEVKASQDSIDRHSLESPINGVVYEMAREAGEWVTAGEPVMRIAQMDRLRIIGFIDGNRYNSNQVADCEVTATVMLPRGRKEQFKGRVVFVEGRRSIKNEFRIRAEVDNRTFDDAKKHWILQPGNIVSMEIRLNAVDEQSPLQAASNIGGVSGGGGSFQK